MTFLAKHLFVVTCLLVAGGGRTSCPADVPPPLPSPTTLLAPRSEAIRSPVGLPAHQRLVLDCLGENGLDEEETESDTPLALAPSSVEPGRPRHGLAPGSSAPRRAHLGRSLSPLVLRC